MLDRALRPIVDPALEALSKPIARAGVSANQATWIGFACGLVAMAAIALGWYRLGLAALLLNRVADGVDGCLARQKGASDLGGYLDIVLDFIVYSGIAFAFAIAAPGDAIAASFLIFSFVGTGTSFLAFAIFAAKRGVAGERQSSKSFYYLGGLTEGTETIAFFVVICLFPNQFAVASYVFGAMCWVTTAGRIGSAVNTFKD
jgi:phosphatidylglycerophosphate synthase